MGFMCYHRYRKYKFLAVVVGIGIVFMLILLIPERVQYDLTFEKKRIDALSVLSSFNSSGQTCVHPVLNLYDESIRKLFYPIKCPSQCSNDEPLIEVDNGYAWIKTKVLERFKSITCEIQYILRNKDFEVYLSKEIIFLNEKNPKFQLQNDFFYSKCTTHKILFFPINQYDTYVGVSKKRIPKPLEKDKFSPDVLMIGLDSLSQLAYRRTLPNVVNFLEGSLDGVILNGYNIVGDGTPQALIPILTGKTEQELPSVLKLSGTDPHVNVYPFIWNEYKKNGYITAYGEDDPSTNTFNYRMTGFDEQPTDHYMRPLYLYLENKKCVAGKNLRSVPFNWVKEFHKVYKDQRKFMFLFLGENSHDDNNRVQCLEDDLLLTLKFLHNGGYLEKSVVILFADHGARFSKHRSSLQGKQEERRPFMGISLPKSIQQQNPELMKNLRKNAYRLSAPFDIYKTLVHLLNSSELTSSSSGLGSSFFEEIPKERTCADVGIDAHWCACMGWKDLSPNDSIVKRGALEFVDYVNIILQPYTHVCHQNKLVSVITAQKLQLSKEMLKFKGNKDINGRIPDFSDNTHEKTLVYQIVVVTSPGDSKFEVTFSYLQNKNQFLFRENTISRINMYGNNADCVFSKTKDDVRKFCFCK